jgi:hypothetical protein
MPWIPPSSIPDGAYKFLMCTGGSLSLFSGGWLLATTSPGRFTLLGILLIGADSGIVRHWWLAR